jgi:hypothetical protein
MDEAASSIGFSADFRRSVRFVAVFSTHASPLLCAGSVMPLTAAPLLADDAEDRAAKAVEKLGGKGFHDDLNPSKLIGPVGF